jgi:hypothetical protein
VRYPVDIPNDTLTRFFREKRQTLEKQVGEVVSLAEQVNKKQPLMDGVFPAPQSATSTLQFAKLFVSTPDHPSVYEQLLKSINAGPAADPGPLAQQLQEMSQQAKDRAAATGANQPSEQDLADLRKSMSDTRIAYYQSHARDIALYAGPECLPPSIPRSAPAEPPDVVTCFGWQFDYWTIQDLLAGIDAANGGGTKRTHVTDSVVKRIERITLGPSPYTGSMDQSAAAGFTANAGGPPAAAPSITGRKGGGPTGLYDTRTATLDLVVASARLPELINAFSKTDFMAVTGLSLQDNDSWADLESGYYYGPDNCVRVHLTVETVWLRSWLTPLMPEAIKSTVAAAAPAPEMAAPPPPPPPPQPTTSKGQPKPKKNVLKKKGRGGSKGFDGD